MCVDPDQKLGAVAILPYSFIDGRALGLLRVVEEQNMAVAIPNSLDDLARAVGAAAIRYDHSQINLILPRQKTCQDCLDMLGFVQTWYHDECSCTIVAQCSFISGGHAL